MREAQNQRLGRARDNLQPCKLFPPNKKTKGREGERNGDNEAFGERGGYVWRRENRGFGLAAMLSCSTFPASTRFFCLSVAADPSPPRNSAQALSGLDSKCETLVPSPDHLGTEFTRPHTFRFSGFRLLPGCYASWTQGEAAGGGYDLGELRYCRRADGGWPMGIDQLEICGPSSLHHPRCPKLLCIGSARIAASEQHSSVSLAVSTTFPAHTSLDRDRPR
ncbi:hypothetical protein F4777DRAFT_185046 [Nemania sp. FL0916]|nr:hypothetical protein F4777DRAFT_185046 [Nemania sp. FL0916]